MKHQDKKIMVGRDTKKTRTKKNGGFEMLIPEMRQTTNETREGKQT